MSSFYNLKILQSITWVLLFFFITNHPPPTVGQATRLEKLVGETLRCAILIETYQHRRRPVTVAKKGSNELQT